MKQPSIILFISTFFLLSVAGCVLPDDSNVLNDKGNEHDGQKDKDGEHSNKQGGKSDSVEEPVGSQKEGEEQGNNNNNSPNSGDEADNNNSDGVKNFRPEPSQLCPETVKVTDNGKIEGGTLTAVYGKCVKSVTFGEGAGFGQVSSESTLYKRGFPDIVLGPPDSEATEMKPSMDVLSLGKDGYIIIDFGQIIYDYEGSDLFVFENPFLVNGGGTFSELGKVSVSLDGEHWTSFPCNYPEKGREPFATCAGLTPTKPLGNSSEEYPLSVEERGGDAFDLSSIGVDKFRYVKIEDMSDRTATPGPRLNTYGFDLDAVGANVRTP